MLPGQVLKEAVKNPHGEIGKKVLKMIEPILTGGGKRTTYGALAARADTGGKRRMCGCAPAFLTFAINDVKIYQTQRYPRQVSLRVAVA